MLFKEKKHEFEIEGKKCSFEIGKLARKSEVGILARMGDTAILVTINHGEANEDAGYFPLSVEYIEKMYASGMISSSRFVKRERYPNDDAILKARIIDRSIRPMFPANYRNEVQVIVKILSYDEECDPMILAINAVSAGFMMSSVPFQGPISGVRVGMVDDKFTALNSNVERMTPEEVTKANMVLAGDGEKLTNIDADMYELPESTALEGMKFGLELMQPWIEAQNAFVKLATEGDEVKKHDYVKFEVDKDLYKEIKENYADEIVSDMKASRKPEESEALEKIYSDYEGKFTKLELKEAYEKASKYHLRSIVWEEGKRVDGRAFDEVRELDSEVGLLPNAHGSGLFTRGMTQILTITTIATIRKQQMVEDMTGEDTRRYMHYYEESPSSYGEVGRYRFIPGRRAVGHGALAEKALYPVLPSEEDFPYTIIAVSEIMSEFGSSSMGSISGSSLSLMDAGVPISKPVAGIALGVIIAEDDDGNLDYGDYQILTDMAALEDFYGFMDFKVAGTKDGVTAIQMDTKAKGLPIEVFEKGFEMANKARLQILEVMNKAISSPRENLPTDAPKVERAKIPTSKIGELIGPGGKNIKELNERTNTEIDVEDDGTVLIFGTDQEGIEEALKYVDALGFEPEKGGVYEGEVVGIENFGAFVEIAPGVSGLLHISEFGEGFIKDIHKVVSMGEKFRVKVLDVSDDGKMKLRKVSD
ncbi:polyribonucleotide nucleotidyltransferase [Candidatus Dojkabacteria bacterium]|nr:polyribonucleotide nucleotidyltransferase [Candidatus Dojkabacteria bacterium]